MRKRLLAVFAAVGFSLWFTPSANAVPMFARMYSYNCSTCHNPGYGQLNKFGYNFRAAGYRIPADIGKDMNDGKFDITNYIAARFSAGGSVKTTTQPSKLPIPDSGSFNLGGDSLYIGGGISKNFFSYSELGLGNGTNIFSGSPPALSSMKMGYVTGNEREFFTVRIGKFGADGFAGSDRGPIGNATIAGTVRPTGTGLELGYTHDDTRVTLAFYDGIQNNQLTGLAASGKAGAVTYATTSTLQAPASDSNNAKDIQLFVNQFIGDDGVAINGTFYNGFNAAIAANGTVNTSTDADWAGQEFYMGAVFLSSPLVKNLDIKVGGEIGQTNTGVFAAAGPAGPTTAGVFGELDYEADEITPIVLRWDSTTANLNAAYQDTEKITFGALTPFVQQVYMNPTYTLTMTNAAAGYTLAHQLSDSLYVFF